LGRGGKAALEAAVRTGLDLSGGVGFFGSEKVVLDFVGQEGGLSDAPVIPFQGSPA